MGKRFTEKEDQFLRDNYHSLNNSEMGRKLKRANSSVRDRLKNLNLNLNLKIETVKTILEAPILRTPRERELFLLDKKDLVEYTISLENGFKRLLKLAKKILRDSMRFIHLEFILNMMAWISGCLFGICLMGFLG